MREGFGGWMEVVELDIKTWSVWRFLGSWKFVGWMEMMGSGWKCGGWMGILGLEVEIGAGWGFWSWTVFRNWMESC